MMDKLLLQEVLSCLSEERITYAYFKDRYCMFLLAEHIGQGKTIQQLKQGTFSQFCNKPLVKQWLSGIGSGYIEPDMVMDLWQQKLHHFTVTLGQWGGGIPEWQQTCRKGYNLVLQLNFTKSHDRFYERIADTEHRPFSNDRHPINDKRNTLAWSRIDMSEDLSVALIEEVQNDWLRLAESALRDLGRCKHRACCENWGIKSDYSLFAQYFLQLIEPLKAIWDEAILCASLEFLVKRIGVKHVYYHGFETGAQLKSIRSDLPPRSLYTKLPKRFGFHSIHQAPEFISADKWAAKKLRKIKQPQWYHMEF